MFAKGQGVKADMEEAIKWFRKAAEAGHAKRNLTLAHTWRTALARPKTCQPPLSGSPSPQRKA